MSRRPLSLKFKGATPEQAALVARKEPHRTERQKVDDAAAEAEVSVPEEKEPKPEPDASEIPAEPIPTKVEEKEPTEKERPEPKKKKTRRSRNVSARIRQAAPATDPLVTQTFRIPQSMSEQLQIASMNRKLKRLFPATQQDIVAEALSDWFEKIEDEG
jgi:hypothetical protein